MFFRAFTQQVAEQLQLTGYVRNREDGGVEVLAEGDRGKLENLLEYLKEGPPNAHVDKVEVKWSADSGNYTGFAIEY